MAGSILYESLSSLLAATVAFAIGISVFLRDRSREQFVLFATFCLNLGLFHLALFFAGFPQLRVFFSWLAEIISLFLPWTADRTFSRFVPGLGGTTRRGLVQGPILSLLLVAQAGALIFPEITSEPAWVVERIALTTYVIGGLLWAASRMWRAARAAAGTAIAPRLRYLFYATLIALLFGSPGIPAIGPIVTAVYLYFVAQTLVRERLLDLPEIAGRIASMTVLVIVVSLVYALLLLWVPASLDGYRSLQLFNIVVASFAVLVLMDPMRAEFERRIEGWLFRDRTALRSILGGLRLRLANLIDPDEMVQVIMDTLEGSGRVTRSALYLVDRKGSLILRGHIGPMPVVRLDPITRRPLIDRLRGRGPLLRDVAQRERDRADREQQAELEEIVETLKTIGASLALPILWRAPAEEDGEDADLLGVLFVDDERLLEPFSREEVELFEGVVAQAAVMIKNSAVYEQRKERERLAALGEMAAGLAHEIRNPLGAIKGAVDLVEPAVTKVDPDTKEFLEIIVEEVGRLNRVVTQFLRYSRPFKGEMSAVNMAEVVQSTVRLLDEESRKRVVVAPAPPLLPPVRGDAEALRQVLLNLVRNAIDAVMNLDPPGIVRLSLGVRRRGLASGDAVTCTVRDNGPGFSSATLTNLFVPFHTTKSGGTGLGLPISQRIVENHRGAIEVTTPEDGGAQFTVVLPIEPQPASPGA
ncbi:MAG: GAF domain-containing protein [Myxococcales bacterium]|nr:GAF domain-containing protein [Myxococcales bacterium]MCB9700693.1 GAF domain-containing protein [Myxococcales bacterium]